MNTLQEALAVKAYLLPEEVENCRENIRDLDNPADSSLPSQGSRKSDDLGDMGDFFENMVSMAPGAMFVESLSMIGQKDDEALIVNTGPAHMVKDFPQLPINIGNRRVVVVYDVLDFFSRIHVFLLGQVFLDQNHVPSLARQIRCPEHVEKGRRGNDGKMGLHKMEVGEERAGGMAPFIELMRRFPSSCWFLPAAEGTVVVVHTLVEPKACRDCRC